MFILTKKDKKIINNHLKLVCFFIGAFLIDDIHAKEEGGYYFPPSLISIDAEYLADLSIFENKGSQLPGTYHVEVYLNGSTKYRRSITFLKEQDCYGKGAHLPASFNDETGLIPRLTKNDLIEIGIDLDSTQQTLLDNEQCVNIAQLIPNAYTEFDFYKMKLNISIPQIALKNRAKDEIPMSQWENGVNALFTSYVVGISSNHYKYDFNKNIYLNLRNGVNLGAWRYRDNRTWTSHKNKHNKESRWQYLNSYIERGINLWHSQLILGDSTTNNAIFDSLFFRGGQLSTDESMYPTSQQGFSPVIRGVANSNATIEIRQNNYLIYQANIASGAFEISDLNAMSSGGDLHVSIIEANGDIQSFTVPYATVPVLLREGRIHYSLTAGELRSNNDNYDAKKFTEATITWGVTSLTTLYGGVQYSTNYLATSVGAGFNLGSWGAISSDITHANSKLSDGSSHQGQSLRFLYARSFPETGTNLQLTGYRYSTKGYYSFQEASLNRMTGWLSQNEILDNQGEIKTDNTDYFNLYDNKRERLQANISQKIEGIGSIYLTGSRQSFWGKRGNTISVQAGLSSQIADINYTLSYGINKSSDQYETKTTEQNIFLTLSLPLQKWLPQDAPVMYASYSANRNSQGQFIQQASLNGSFLPQQNLNWNIAQGYSSESGNDGNLNIAYQGSYGNTQVGYGYGKDYRKVSAGISGGVTLHSDGVIFSQPLGETNMIIAAPGASDIPVEHTSGVRTDWSGYTVKPYATPYRLNRISLDGSQLDEKTEIENSVITTVPTRGAFVKANFVTHHGSRALVHIVRNGKNLPFGTLVSVGEQQSMVNDDGLVYLSGLNSSGELIAKWGEDEESQCRTIYTLPENANEQSLVRFEVNCQ